MQTALPRIFFDTWWHLFKPIVCSSQNDPIFEWNHNPLQGSTWLPADVYISSLTGYFAEMLPVQWAGAVASARRNRACSSKQHDTLCYLGGDPYGSSQSGVDGITATLVLMRSSLALMSDGMTVRGGPHGSRPGSWENRPRKHCSLHAINTWHSYTQCTW